MEKITNNEIERQFRNALKTFDTSRSWDIEPILMTQFNRINAKDELFNRVYTSPDKTQFIERYQRFNEIIIDVAKQTKSDVIDLSSFTPSNNKYMYDVIHLNEYGSVHVADIIFKFFQEKLKISEKGEAIVFSPLGK